jgi:hypothetical protein
MKKNIIKIQMPMSKKLKEIGEGLAMAEGLSSYQELLRFWTMQAYKGNLFIRSKGEEISYEQSVKYHTEAMEAYEEYKSGKRKGYSNAEDLIKALDNDENNDL